MSVDMLKAAKDVEFNLKVTRKKGKTVIKVQGFDKKASKTL